jgi:predicted nuclease of predicted toxin-antitoxin system
LTSTFPFHIAAGLRRRNIDVTTAADVRLNGATDMEHLAFASSQRRVVATHDDDLRLHAQGAAHTGIAYCRQQSMTIGELLRRVVLLHDLLSPEEMIGRVEFL